MRVKYVQAKLFLTSGEIVRHGSMIR
jgi:hypothetical protein